jgi:hypothetical protein
MTEQLLNKIEGAINDLDSGLMDKVEAKNYLLQLFLDVLMPAAKAKEHLELFMFRVHNMRAKQLAYYDGDKKLLPDCKRLEKQVDNAIIKLETDFKYSMKEAAKKYEQPKLL